LKVEECSLNPLPFRGRVRVGVGYRLKCRSRVI
jgi:hypothetical protein